MAKLGISRDVRAEIQSHGLGGVQYQFYDRHDYAEEKRKALEAWAKYLKDIANGAFSGSNVVTLKRA